MSENRMPLALFSGDQASKLDPFLSRLERQGGRSYCLIKNRSERVSKNYCPIFAVEWLEGSAQVITGLAVNGRSRPRWTLPVNHDGHHVGIAISLRALQQMEDDRLPDGFQAELLACLASFEEMRYALTSLEEVG